MVHGVDRFGRGDGIVVASNGEDRQAGTPDDIGPWDLS